jgi:hypothetical protein
MEPCQHFQDLLLDSLYGLLDAGAEEVLRAHVAVCPDCAQAMDEARSQQELLGRAAQVIRQVPAFVAPQEQPLTTAIEAVPKPTAEVVPLPARRRPWKRWLGIAAAAALLLAAGAGWAIYQRGLQQHQTDFATARKLVANIDTQFAQLQNSAKEEKEKRIAKAHDQLAHLRVAGPGTYQADAPNPLWIATRDVAGKPVAATIVTRFLSADKKELFHAETSSQGEQLVSLPAGLKVAGNKEAKLVVESTSLNAHARIEETIRIQEPTLVTHLALNKALFQVGEVMFFRTLTLERFSLKPAAEKIPLLFTLLDAKGRTIKQIPGQTEAGGIGGGEFALTNDLAAGEYTLRITQAGPSPRLLPQERRVEILRDSPPQFQFDRAQYFAGQTGRANFLARKPAAGFGKAQDLEIKGQVDGKGVSINGAPPGASVKMRTDAQGKAPITFTLPKTIKQGEASLNIQVQSGTYKENVSQPIPVVASNLVVDFFPEGGDLLAGVPNRVYYRLRTPLGEPVKDAQASIVIRSMREPKKVILKVEQNQGLGIFTFTPEVGETYRLWVTNPTGMTEIPDPFRNIRIQSRGIALSVPGSVSGEGDPLKVVVHNTGPERRLAVLASCRGRVVAEEFLLAAKGENHVNLAAVSGTRGMVRLTVLDSSSGALNPLAERLIYRVPAGRLQLSIHGLKNAYRRGERAELHIKAADEQGRKTPAWIGALVVDERAAADAGAASPQAHFYLLNELGRGEDLENADLILADSPEGRRALDLFLGTQGWRRFVPAQPAEAELLAKNKDAKTASAFLFSRENSSPAALAALHDTQLKDSLEQLNRETARKRRELAQEKEQQLADARLASLALAHWQSWPGQMLRLSVGFLVLALLAAGVLLLIWGLVKLGRSASPTLAFAGSCCAFLVCLILYGTSGSLPLQPADETRLLAGLSKQAWPQMENAQVSKTASPPSFPSGEFALAPAKTEDKPTGLPMSSSIARAASRTMAQLAKADHMGGGGALAPIEPQMQKRFLDALNLEMRGGDKGKAPMAHPPLTAVTGGKAKEAKKNQGMMDLAREYSFAYKNTGRRPATPATVLWYPNLFAAHGSATVSFDLAPNGGDYRVILFGNSPSGRLGSFQGKLQTGK